VKPQFDWERQPLCGGEAVGPAPPSLCALNPDVRHARMFNYALEHD